MQIVQQDREIDGVTYRVGPLTAAVGRKLLVELKSLLGPTLAEIVRGAGSLDLSEKSLLDMDLGPVANAIAAFAEDVTPEKYEYIVTTLASQSQYSEDGGKFIPFKMNTEHFRGRYLSEIKWLAFALEVNYSDFLSVLNPTTNALSALVAEASKSRSQTSSTGTSGESSQVNATQ